jgi:hypothetical protein
MKLINSYEKSECKGFCSNTDYDEEYCKNNYNWCENTVIVNIYEHEGVSFERCANSATSSFFVDGLGRFVNECELPKGGGK